MAKDLNINILAKDKTAKAFSSVKRSLKSVGSALTGFKAKFIAAISGAAIIRAFQTAADSIDALAKKSATLGVAVEWMQKMQYAAALGGVSIDQFNSGMVYLSKAAAEASQGVGLGSKAFEALGISATDASGKIKTLEMLVPEISDALSKMEDPVTRSKVAMELFGRSGVDMVNVLGSGSEALGNTAQQFEDFGLIVSNVAAKDVENMNDAFSGLWAVMGGIVNRMTAEFAPAIGEGVQWVTRVLAMAVKQPAMAWDAFFQGLLAAFYGMMGGLEVFGVGIANTLISSIEFALNGVMRYGTYAVNWLIGLYNRLADKLGFSGFQTLSMGDTKIDMGRMEASGYWQQQSEQAWQQAQTISGSVEKTTQTSQRATTTTTNKLVVERVVMADGTSVIKAYN